MKRHRGRLIAVAAAAVPVLALTACAGSTTPASTQKPVNKVFTYDTTAPVMVDGWDPATEYSDGILAMSEMYETLTHYNSATNTVGPMLATSWSSAAGGPMSASSAVCKTAPPSASSQPSRRKMPSKVWLR